MASDDDLQRLTVYRHLDYAWDLFGVGLPHLALAALPGVLWGALVALISPDIFNVSATTTGLFAVSGAAILDAFRPIALPNVSRPLGFVAGALPGVVLSAARLLPDDSKAQLPLWPSLPLVVGALAAMAVWQYRRAPNALLVAWRWSLGPRLYAGHTRPRRPLPPLPVDRRLLP